MITLHNLGVTLLVGLVIYAILLAICIAFKWENNVKSLFSILRFVIALPLAIPMFLIGYLLAHIWQTPGAMLVMAGFWLLGVEPDFG